MFLIPKFDHRRVGIMKKLALTCFAIASCIGLTSPVIANDCIGVDFKMINRTGAGIKLKKMTVYNKTNKAIEKYTENLPNKRIDDGKADWINNQRLNKLDSGDVPEFWVYYDKRDKNGRWESRSEYFSDQKTCRDDADYHLVLDGWSN